MLFDKVKSEHIRKGIRDYEEKGLPNGFRPSSTYDLVIVDKIYPPKAIMAYANYHAVGRKIENYFSGGDGTDCFKAFERCRFIVEKKTNNVIEKLYKLKEEFLDKWPIEKLEQMTLEEYTNLDKTSFGYWIEHITRDLGSVAGGSSYKFGIYKRNSSSEVKEESNRTTDGDYAWFKKYGGNTKEEAFTTVKAIIIKIAKSVQANNLEDIDAIDLGHAYKWKIAFLYGDYNCLNMFKLDALRVIASNLNIDYTNKTPISKFHRNILSLKPEETEYFAYVHDLWHKYESRLIDVKKDFAKWLNTNTFDSYRAYLGNTTKSIEEKLDKINTFFDDIDFFLVDPNKVNSLVSTILFLLSKKERVKNPDFVDYDARNSNGIPKAILGKNNYIKFLKEKFDYVVPNYWIFQGNPDIYNITDALKESHLKSWKAAAHKDKIKIGDQVILWQTGSQSGCYALAEVTSDVRVFEEETNEQQYYADASNASATERVKIKIIKNLVDSPILNSDIKENLIFSRFKAGNQGTNFSATEEEYTALLNWNHKETNYWLYAPGRNAEHWDVFYNEGIMGLGWDEIGDLKQYNTKDEIRDALREAYGGEGNKMNNVTANYNFVNTMQIGDVVIVKQGRSKLLGYGIVTSDYFYNDKRKNYTSCRTVDWKLKGDWHCDHSLVLKTLTDITKLNSEYEGYNKYYEYLMNIMNTNNKDLFELYNVFLTENRRGQIQESTIEGYVKTAAIEIPERWNKLYDEKFDTFILNDSNLRKMDPLMDKGFSGYTSFRPFIYNLIDKFKVYIEPTNQILYGPPGTGKTYYLKDQLFERYTSNETTITKGQYLENKINELSWWEVIIIALLDLKKAKVPEIRVHEWVQIKERLSNSNSVNNTIWTQLQTHTVDDCENVKFRKRRTPQVFKKTEDSYWEILEDQVEELVPELYELRNSVNNYNPDPEKIIKHYSFVTFHQSFAYEDFIEGIKPVFPENEEEVKDLGYTIEDGVFKNLCNRAKNDPDNRYAIFIDEINRGNVSAIFGELITLIETDKRQGTTNQLNIKLPYSKKEFSVPSNLDIYGTMNTADRSVEALDTALRRRFEFKEMMPDYTVIKDDKVGNLQLSEVLKTINQRIELLIDRDHTIGHSYFVGVNTEQKLANAFNNKIVPLLQEYFYGDYGKIGLVLGKGFVEKIKNDKVDFANFEYENANDYKIPSYQLKLVNELSVEDAVSVLLGVNEVVTE